MRIDGVPTGVGIITLARKEIYDEMGFPISDPFVEEGYDIHGFPVSKAVGIIIDGKCIIV